MSRPHPAYSAEEEPAPVPLTPAGTMDELYPPMCIRSHWDAGMILRWTLPDQHVGLPMDFRPYTKVCKNYVTSAPAACKRAPT